MNDDTIHDMSPKMLREMTRRDLSQQFPSVTIWWGNATGKWWAYIRIGSRGWLLEAHHPRELAQQIMRVQARPR